MKLWLHRYSSPVTKTFPFQFQMLTLLLLVSSFCFCQCIVENAKFDGSASYQWETKYFEQLVDHFNFGSGQTFQQKYLINEESFKSGGPIFLYTGNEGAIEAFADNTGFMWESAPEFGAVIIFVEHRYYGESQPFGKKSMDNPANRQYFTVQQALADYANFIIEFKTNNPKYSESGVIAFGGSYGGMLASWLRMKYPNLVSGALAGSAPIWQFDTPCDSYNHVVYETFQFMIPNCPQNIKNSFSTISQFFEKDSSEALNFFKVCKNGEFGYGDFIALYQNALSTAPMVNYPYAANFLQPLPAWPCKEMCSGVFENPNLTNDTQLLNGAYHILNTFYNSSGQLDCFDLKLNSNDKLGADVGWNWQSCSQILMPMCADDENDFFPKQPWNEKQFNRQCEDTFSGNRLQPHNWEWSFFGKHLQSASNIIFSNGLLDPWHPGGVLKAPNKKIYVFIMRFGAHHLDLRASNANDTKEVEWVRRREKRLIKAFLAHN